VSTKAGLLAFAIDLVFGELEGHIQFHDPLLKFPNASMQSIPLLA
jgi:hypothetical protein